MVFEFFGEVHIPYPPGYLFPDTNLSTGYPIVDGGALDPYLWLHAIQHGKAPGVGQTIGAERSVSSRGDVFSYRFSVSGEPGESQVHFEYENRTQQGRFKMHSLAWIDYGSSALGDDVFNCITFSCFGIWEKNDVERVVQAAVQLATSENITYVGIQVGAAGRISNVNTLLPATAFPVPLKAAVAVGLVPSSSTQEANGLRSAQPLPEKNKTTY
jgi:hypothetical protein